jgi:hypothetical protein
MLDIFTPEQKAVILASVMREESEGRSLRDCCRAQGITVQTFIDWKARAQKHSQNGARPVLGIHPERRKDRQPKPPTALELALRKAQISSYPKDEPEHVGHDEPPPHVIDYAGLPEDNPHDLHALTHGEPENKDVPDSPNQNEVSEVPRKQYPDYSQGGGVTSAMYAACPFLPDLDRQTFDALGPRPDKNVEKTAYNRWIAHRKTLMTPEQRTAFEGFFGGSRLGIPRGQKTKVEAVPEVEAAPVPVAAAPKRAPKPKQREEQREIAAARGRVTNGPGLPVSPAIQELAAQHAEVTGQLSQYEGGSVGRPRADAHAGEIERLKRALMALTLENLQLRGLL